MTRRESVCLLAAMKVLRRTRGRLVCFTSAFVLAFLLFGAFNIHALLNWNQQRHHSSAGEPDDAILVCDSSPCSPSAIDYGGAHPKWIPAAAMVTTTESHPSPPVPDGVDIYSRYKIDFLGLEPLKDVRPLRPESDGLVINDVAAFQYSINVGKRCHDRRLSVIIVVVSAPGNLHKRNLIRRTWAARLNNATFGRHVFFVGRTLNDSIRTSIEHEQRDFGDIVQLDMIDKYDILTVKSVALLHWADRFCRRVPFVLKCDDDVFVNSVQLEAALAAIRNQVSDPQNGLYGTYVTDNPPQRKPGITAIIVRIIGLILYIFMGLLIDLESKHYVSRGMWPWPSYPSYLYGGCYLLGRKALAPLLAAAQTTPYFPFEDLYLIGLCSRKAKIPLWASDR